MDEELSRFIEYAKSRGLTPSVAALVRTAEERGIPWMGFPERHLVQLGHGRNQKLVYGTITSNTSRAAIMLAADKGKTNRLLLLARLPVPKQRVVHTAEQAVQAAESIGYPVVLKPLQGAHGDGVSIRPPTAAAVRAAFHRACGHDGAVVVEGYVQGFDYRMLVVNHQVVAAARRVPALVVGDGVRTVRQLVEKANEDSARSEGHENLLTSLKIDGESMRLLARQSCVPDTVPETGQAVYLRETANISTGGTAIDVTDLVHAENRDLAIEAADTVGLDIAGVDFICADISKSFRVVGGAICEVNAAPGLRMHLAPSDGRRRDVAAPIIDMLFPLGTPNSIPIVSIAGAARGENTPYILAEILSCAGCVVGLSTAEGSFVDGQPLRGGTSEMCDSCRLVLEQATVQAAVFELPHGRPMASASFRPDVVTYLSAPVTQTAAGGIDCANHVADPAPRPRTGVVLNADDPGCVKMAAGYAKDRVCYVSTNRPHAVVNRHIMRGGAAVVPDGRAPAKRFKIYDRGREYASIAHNFPISAKATVPQNLHGAMFAAATAYLLGTEVSCIAVALRKFRRRKAHET